MSATPLIQPRSIQNMFKGDLSMIPQQLPTGVSQKNSPKLKDQKYSGIRQPDLHSIEEEKGRDQEQRGDI